MSHTRTLGVVGSGGEKRLDGRGYHYSADIEINTNISGEDSLQVISVTLAVQDSAVTRVEL